MTRLRFPGLAAFITDRSAVSGAAVLLAITLLGLSAGLLFSSAPMEMVGRPYQWPGSSWSHPLGTDMLGRDILRDTVFASRTSLIAGAGAAFISIGLGVACGAAAGFYGGIVDSVVTRTVEIVQTVPSLLFAIVVVAVLGASTATVIGTIGLMGWPTIARLVRAETLRVKQLDYVRAARVIGMGDLEILVRHVVPNAIYSTVAMSGIVVASAILTESTLAFLGLGIPNQVSWGGMVSVGKDSLRAAWYISAVPGVAICMTVIALSAVSSGMNRVMNPRGE